MLYHVSHLYLLKGSFFSVLCSTITDMSFSVGIFLLFHASVTMDNVDYVTQTMFMFIERKKK